MGRHQAPPHHDLIERVIFAATLVIKVGKPEILSTRRSRRLSYARHIVMHVLATTHHVPITAIGRHMGRDHTTVIHARDRIATLRTYSISANADCAAIIRIASSLDQDRLMVINATGRVIGSVA